MAEEIKKVVSVDVSKAAEDIKSLSDELEGMDGDILSSIKSFKDYKTAIEHLSVSLSKMDEGTDEYESTLSDLNKVQNAYNEAISISKTKTDAAAGSYNALSKEMSELKKAWKSTNDEGERETIGKRIVEINDKLKSMDASIGNYQRNVGNYSSAFTEGLEKIGEKFEALNNPMALAKKGVSALSGAFKALIANPIGAVIAAIVVSVKALVSAFKQNEEASNKLKIAYSKLEPIINAFKTVMGSIVNVIGDVIVWISKLAGNIFNSWSKIGKIINSILPIFNPVIDAVKGGFGVMSRAAEGFVKVYTSIIDSVAKASVKIAEWMNKIGLVSNEKLKQMQDIVNAEQTVFGQSTDIAEREIALEQRKRSEMVETAKMEAEISELKSKVVETDKYTAKERQEMLQRAIDLEKEINDERLAIAKEEFDLAAEKARLAPNSKEDNDKLAESEANYYRVKKEYTEKIKELNSQLVSSSKELTTQISTETDGLVKAQEMIQDSLAELDAELAKNDETDYKKFASEEEEIANIQNRLNRKNTPDWKNELDDLQAKYDAEKALMEQHGYDTTELTRQFEEQKTKIITDERKRQRDELVAARIVELEEAEQKRHEYAVLADDISTILGSIGDGWNALLDQQYKTGKLSEKEYKRRQKAMQAFQIASVIGSSAAAIFDLWSGYAKEVGVINAEGSVSAGMAAPVVKATLDAKSLISVIAKTATIASTAATQIAAIKSSSSSSSSSSGSSSSAAASISSASISSSASGYTPNYSQTVLGSTDVSSLQNAVSSGTQEGQQKMKVYVVASEITEKQNETKTLVTESTF